MSGLRKDGFLSEASVAKPFATPRRLAVQVTHVAEKAPDVARELLGPSITAAAPAGAGFA